MSPVKSLHLLLHNTLIPECWPRPWSIISLVCRGNGGESSLTELGIPTNLEISSACAIMQEATMTTFTVHMHTECIVQKDHL